SPGALREYLYPLGYWETVRGAAQAHGVDALLVLAVIRQESHFEPEALSSAGARGLMQLLPATARQVASADGAAPPAEPALEDVGTNIDLGTRLLARLLRHYAGSMVKALAAYNGGEDAVAERDRGAGLGEHGGEDGLVGGGERGHELVLEDPAPAGVRAGLEHSTQPPPRVALAERRERAGDRRRMVGEVVDDGHPADRANHLLAPPHAAELRQRGRPVLPADADLARDQEDAERVARVDRAGRLEREAADR